ncbi:hypothetical protein [Hoeflea sp. EC-HK425]|uniref:hypothetical protein n=1 Tax=Hoeflea sp. EC-HK425 TaxID=2038388 RepID=UPI00125340D3|nr:hypothetical protein [Hoeflea sp. EC-HK425]VVT28241.1 conserved hypothetical protein [Hoeflea sp. EC-HK425]|tara:strand:- start:1099 stop:1335 length:237 start_codon:yes stop_codon:yes gene_type:complete
MTLNQNTGRQNPEFVKELAALARLVTFARQSAQSLDIEFPTYCLELALGSIFEEIVEAGADVTQVMACKDRSDGAELH